MSNHPSPANLDPNLRMLARVAEIMPNKMHELVSSFAADGDLELLESALQSGIIVAPVKDEDRLELLTAIFPVGKAASDKERADKLIKDWVELLGVKGDPQSLSKYLAGLQWAVTVQGIMDMGGDPNYLIRDGGGYRTPIGTALDRGRTSGLQAMLTHLLQRNEVPLCYVDDIGNTGKKPKPVSLFARLLEGMRESGWINEAHAVTYLTIRELPTSWKKAIGEAIADCKGEFEIAATSDAFDSFINLLSVAEFDDAAQW